jgi:hypothetical protein
MSRLIVDALGRTPEERAKANELKAAVNAEAAANWHDPKWREEMAAELTQNILWGFEYENLLDVLIDVERLDFNARSFIKEAQGLQAFWMARGGHIEASTMTADVIELPREMLGFHVSEFEDKLKTNFAETIQTLSTLAVQRLDAEVNKRVLTVLQAAINATTNTGSYVSTAGMQKSVLDKAIRDVRDESRVGAVSLVGRHSMTEQISDFPGFGWETQEEIRQKGVLGVYRGATIVTFKNYREFDFRLAGGAVKSFFPANELYVLGKDCGKFAFYGDLMDKSYVEPDNWYWHYIGRRDTGALVSHAHRARRIVDSTVTP